MQGLVRCSECRFYSDVVKVQGGFLRGVCKRHPVSVSDKKGLDWCGDAESKDSLPTPGTNRRVS